MQGIRCVSAFLQNILRTIGKELKILEGKFEWNCVKIMGTKLKREKMSKNGLKSNLGIKKHGGRLM